MNEALQSVAGDGALTFGGLGLLLAVVLLGAMRLLLPRAELSKLKVPLGLLAGHVVLMALGTLTEPDGAAEKAFRLGALLLLLFVLGRAGFLLLVDSILVRRLSRPIPKIFRDILEGLVYTAAVLITLRSAGAQLDALLTTSALLTAVIGLSLQDTLGNLFAGLAIQAQNPFEVGDWIQWSDDPETTGRVIEINWRATRVVTLDDVEVIIPNGPLARNSIKNFTKPTVISRRSLRLVVPFEREPAFVQKTIAAGLRETPGILAHPAPSVVTEGFEERGVRYWVRYFTDDFESREVTDGLARDRIWYALRRQGIEYAVPIADIDVRQDDEVARQRERNDALRRRQAALRGVDFLRVLTDEQLAHLAGFLAERPYAAGERIIGEGDAGDEFFIVQKGEVAVSIEHDGRSVEVARLQAGSFFGEMSLMTGAPRSATIRTLTPCTLLVVDKAAFQEVLQASPELAESISDVLTARQEQLDSASSKTQAQKIVGRGQAERRELLHRIKEFFSL